VTVVRPPRDGEEEVIVQLLYETAAGLYDQYTGSPRAARRILLAAYGRPGTTASREVVLVAESGGEVAGAVAAFPVTEGDDRARRFLRLTIRRTPPWRWARTMQIFRLGGQLTPPAPADAIYVDALATAESYRRRGIATALLRAVEERARAAGLAQLALDTADRNTGAQALYEGFGMERTQVTRGAGDVPGSVGYVKRL
jgi:GNAT superfamily N-acetyltransferase